MGGSVIREGDVQALGITTSSKLNDEVMIEVIRSPEKLLLVVINTKAHGYSNLLCHTGIVNRHWTFESQTIQDIVLDTSTAPDVTALSNWQEVVDGSISPIGDVKVDTDGHKVTLSKV